MLLPQQSDIVLLERHLQEEGETKKGKKGAPRSQLGVLALQRENDPDWQSKAQQIHSLRVPGGKYSYFLPLPIYHTLIFLCCLRGES